MPRPSPIPMIAFRTYLCINCGAKHYPTRKGRCKCCDSWLHNHDEERPRKMFAHGEIPCVICGKCGTIWNDRCVKCYSFRNKQGRDRTKDELRELGEYKLLKSRGLKRCKKCKAIRRREEFITASSSPGTKKPWCRTCDLAAFREFRNSPAGKASRKAASKRRRAKKAGAVTVIFSDSEIYERDDWRCQLCGRKTDRRKKSPHPRSPSIDHIIPISKGGSHTPGNCQCACLLCNATKQARMGGRGSQLRCF